MEFKQFSENVTRAKYAKPQTLVAFISIGIFAIVAFILAIRPFSGSQNINPALAAKQFHRVKLATPEYVAPVNTAKIDPDEDLHWKNITIHEGDKLTNLLRNHSVSADDIAKLVALKKKIASLNNLKSNHTIRLGFDEHHNLQVLRYRYTDNKWLIVTRKDNTFTTSQLEQQLESHVHFAHSTIKSNFYSAGHAAGLSDYLIHQLISNFAWDIDFAKDIHPGDSFSVIYNDIYLGDRKVRDGDVLAATFKTQGKVYKLVRYTDKRGNHSYYTPKGLSNKRAFLRTPVKYNRISSYFAPARYHPILNKIRAHHGVDYAAPSGTPIRAAGNGYVIMRKYYGGYGNIVKIKHDLKYTTVYGHLSRFASDIRLGSRVHQGQIIGYVGQTGLASGPHLHYEMRIFGKYVNPISVKLPNASPIAREFRKDFFIKTRTLFAELDLYEQALAANSKHKVQVL